MEKILDLTTYNLSVYQGEKVLIKGNMASGKTKLLETIAQQLPNNQFDFLSQTLDLNFVPGTVAENLAFNLENDALSANVIKTAILETAETYNLTTELAKPVFELPTYPKQVLAIAQILIHPMPILLLDDPLFLPEDFTGTLFVTGDFDEHLFDHVISLSAAASKQETLDQPLELIRDINFEKAILSVTEIEDTLTFSVFQGEKVMITSTSDVPLADILAGFSETTGEIDFYYEDITHQLLNKRARKIGYVMANPQDMIVVPKVKDMEISDEILTLCGLLELKDKKVSELSFKQRKLFSTACILMQKTPVIIFDQPEVAYFTDILTYLDYKGVTVILTSAKDIFLPLMDRQVIL